MRAVAPTASRVVFSMPLTAVSIAPTAREVFIVAENCPLWRYSLSSVNPAQGV